MKRISIAATALTAVVAAAGTVSAFAATKSIKIGDDFFSPKSVSVKKNDTVKWTWTGDSPHNVTVRTGPVKFHSKTQSTGTYSKKLTKKGTFKIYCTIHGTRQSLTIKVR